VLRWSAAGCVAFAVWVCARPALARHANAKAKLRILTTFCRFIFNRFRSMDVDRCHGAAWGDGRAASAAGCGSARPRFSSKCHFQIS
jgi:hypothetical protein